MITTSNITLSFGRRVLFKDVSIKFTPGNCYGLIGANGSGKSTFLKILSGEIEPSQGEVVVDKKLRLAVLRQDHFAFDDCRVIDTVIMGHKKLHEVLKEREILYAKEEMTEADGMRSSELEMLVADMNGWEAESDAAVLLSGLGINDSLHDKLMRELDGGQKVRILLAQALFGNPDILLLDEPTNHLDIESISWLEEFLSRFENTVIVVSHDRHFLNTVCTHIADIDYTKIQIYLGNYDFWYQSSQLALNQKKNENKKKEARIAELEEFIRRFSANASKARQATSRKKLLTKINLEELPASSRKFPYVAFRPDRACGNNILHIENLEKTIDGVQALRKFNLTMNDGDKIALIGNNSTAKSTLLQIAGGDRTPDAGTLTWGTTIKTAYFPKENSHFFTRDESIVDWLSQYCENEETTTVRGALGRMLFSGDEALKKLTVLSGGERVRCLLAKMMLSGANALVLDEPTNHLDLESITALNTGLIEFPGVILFTSHDHEFVSSIANRIVEFTYQGVIDRRLPFDEYITDPQVMKLRDSLYQGHDRINL
ncbi:MAG: ABC transporter ATP-binding protein [Elusimicrobia bacterium RIFOXYB2_FULL_49_7]|nr:MAG: ABC transporter ATP-binding protein [Elusimicrobia bacterium RIFOXYB2_FULL_49_7]